MELQGKKLLLMGGGAFAKDIQKYAKEQGIYLIAVGNIPDVPIKKIADEVYDIDTQDVDCITKLVVDRQIDGIFVGAAEENVLPAIKVSEQTGCLFYATQEQWDILSDKKQFKNLLNEFNLPVIPEYDETENSGAIDYPVIVKPADGNGAKGITVCHKAEELQNAINYAKQFSVSDRVIIEKYLNGKDDVFIRYHFQNGKYSISSSFDKYSIFPEDNFTGMPIIYLHPTKHLQTYIDKYDTKIQSIFKKLNLQNGVITLQGFVDENETFYFYEAGYRLGGSQTYLFTDMINHSNSLQYMINLALTGEMADYDISERDNPFFNEICCNQYVPLRSGTITVMDGIEELLETPGILNITKFNHVGDKIEQTGDLRQVCLRMHIMGSNTEELNDLLRIIDDKLNILDENGNDMRLCHVRNINDIENMKVH